MPKNLFQNASSGETAAVPLRLQPESIFETGSQDSVDSIIGLTIDVGRIMRKQLFNAAEGGKLPSMPQLHALMSIREHDGMTMKEFAGQLQIAQPSATSFVTRLVKLGWVRRAADRTNRKLVRLHLTPDAVRILALTMEKRKEVLGKTLGLIPEADRRAFLRILNNLLHVLQKNSSR